MKFSTSRIYEEVTSSWPMLSMVVLVEDVNNWIDGEDVDMYFGTHCSCAEHTLNFLWLILCIEGYES